VLPVAGLTALRTLRVAGMPFGRRVLVTGAAGGVGRLAVQLANQAGAHVTAVARDEQRAEGLRELGADELMSVLESDGESFDVILESVGGASLAAALQRLRPEGIVVSFGDSSQEPCTFPASAVYRSPGARLYGFLIFREVERSGSAARDLELLAGMVGRGELDPQIAFETSWRDAAPALEALLDRQVKGKAVMNVD
jgi:NADPH:quinone reductase-like Zn-dependent oxidoreductase